MMDKFRFLILLLIVRGIKVWNWRKKTYIFICCPRESKVFILFLRNEKTEKGEEESMHEEKSGNTIFINH